MCFVGRGIAAGGLIILNLSSLGCLHRPVMVDLKPIQTKGPEFLLSALVDDFLCECGRNHFFGCFQTSPVCEMGIMIPFPLRKVHRALWINCVM